MNETQCDNIQNSKKKNKVDIEKKKYTWKKQKKVATHHRLRATLNHPNFNQTLQRFSVRSALLNYTCFIFCFSFGSHVSIYLANSIYVDVLYGVMFNILVLYLYDVHCMWLLVVQLYEFCCACRRFNFNTICMCDVYTYTYTYIYVWICPFVSIVIFFVVCRSLVLCFLHFRLLIIIVVTIIIVLLRF